MGTSWAELSDDPLKSGGDIRNQEAVERDREKWRLTNANDPTAIQTHHISATGAPEDLGVLPQDFDFLPQNIQADIDEWQVVPDPE